MHRIFIIALLICSAVSTSTIVGAAETFHVVVMDPMAAPLACDCVQGYAQRKYEALETYLQKQLDCPVKVYWSGSLTSVLKEHQIQADLVIGKHSVVLADAKVQGIELQPIAQLSNPDGSLTQTGLIVVRHNDAAKSVKDLSGYRIFFGPQDCDEKHLAAKTLLTQYGVALPAPLEISDACSTAAATLMELPASEKAAAVISSYAAPLLEGCGTIKQGDLRVIGTSAAVPFITAFMNADADPERLPPLRAALRDVELHPELLIALETSLGFVDWKTPPVAQDPASDSDAAGGGSKKKS